jgi:hypothetical protein
VLEHLVRATCVGQRQALGHDRVDLVLATSSSRTWSNAVKLGTDREDVDLRRVGVELDFIGRPFDAVTVRPVSLDHSGTCPVSPWAEAFLGDLVDGFGECVGESVRGKSPPG